MISRLAGTLESVRGVRCVVALSSGDVAHEVLVPACLGESLAARIGTRVSLVTFQYLESQGQGSSFIPRLIGFATEKDREFFELFTTVKGIGYRKALRAMALPASEIAGAIARRDTRALVELPEIGKRMAETIIAELSGKVEGYLSASEVGAMDAAAAARPESSPVQEEAVLALIGLGEPRLEAESLVTRALDRARREKREMASVEELLGAVFGMRGR